MLHAAKRRPLAVPGLQHEERALLDGELDVLHLLVVTFELVLDLEQLAWHSLQVVRELRMGSGSRMPATTSSPCAFIKNSP
jgi:hypothetical protein